MRWRVLVVHLISMTDWKDPEEQAEDKQQSTNVLPQVYASHDCLDVVGLPND